MTNSTVSNIIAAIAALIIIAAIIIMGFNAMVAETATADNTPITVKAVIVKTVGDEITVETTDGNVWSFYGEGFDNSTQAMITFLGGEIIDAEAI